MFVRSKFGWFDYVPPSYCLIDGEDDAADAGGGGAAPSLRDMLATAADEHDGEAVKPDDAGDATQGKEAAGERPDGRARGPDGKFIPKDAADGVKDEAGERNRAPVAVTGQIEERPAEQAPAQPAVAVDAPVHWPAADKEKFTALPTEARAFVLDLNKRMEAGFTPKLMRGAQLERDYAPVEQIFAPYQDALRAQNMTPAHIIQRWASVEQALISHKSAADSGQGNGRGAEIVANLIKSYNVNPGEVAELLTGQRQPQRVAQVDPQLLRTVQELQADAQVRRQQDERTRLAGASQQIEAFANEKDPEGNLMHPFFSNVEQDMAALALISISAGRQPNVSDLYDRAVYANPQTRKQLLALESEREAKQAAIERKAKAEAAKRAGSSVTGSTGAGQTQRQAAQSRSLRQTIEEAAQDLDAA